MSAPTPTRTRALLVVAHPRPDSLTAALAGRARARLVADGHEVDVLDLYAEDFDPRMTPADEPDWADPGKSYSPEVRSHMARLDAADTIVVVFPLWWFGLPAILKGWIDRVWNHGFAYGDGGGGGGGSSPSRLAGKRLLWLAVAAYGERQFAARGWEETVSRLLRTGIAAYCGIEDATVGFVYDSLTAGETALKAGEEILDGFVRAGERH
ncbi:NAD(P)H oxidoreductase [Streptomyces sp. NPDC089799]|uniref:NAD(P)H oxidoreductase n=1 Tax=Streptomyces sp. NPDC089799 TaxID=3155066 RepID=UPI00343A27A7